MKRRIFLSLSAVLLTALVFVLPIIHSQISEKAAPRSETVDKAGKSIVNKDDQNSKEPDTPKPSVNENVTFLVRLNGESLLDTVIASNGRYGSVKELIVSADGKRYIDVIKKNQAIVKASIQKLVTGSEFNGCRTYTAVMNGFTVNAPADSLSKLQSINGVSSVTMSMQQDRFFTIEDENTDDTENTNDTQNTDNTENTDNTGSVDNEYSNAAYPSKLQQAYKGIINADASYDLGYDGSGVLIAVLDSEFNIKHEYFSAMPKSASLETAELTTLYERVGFNTDALPEKKTPYIDRKIVFAYDYAENDPNTADVSLDHGTAVAAAAAGNNGIEGEDAFRGIAYGSQLALMKIAKERDSENNIVTEPCTVLAALDDSVKIGADVICMGFGEYRESMNSLIYKDVTEKLSKAGVYVVCPSGNGSFNGSSYGQQSLDAADIDYAAENYLSALSGVLTFGSAMNMAYEQKYLVINGNEVDYAELCNVGLDSAVSSEDGTIEYICLDADGKREDYQTIDISGKLVIINSSTLTPDKVYENAVVYEAAAIAVIYDGDSSDYTLSEDIRPSVPFILIDSKWTEQLHSKPKGTAVVRNYGRYVVGSESANIAEHTSYAALSGTGLAPRVLACGDMVYSASAGGKDGYYSGSSVACAQGAGICALLHQKDMNDAQTSVTAGISDRAKAKLLSTSEPIKYGVNTEDEQLYLSPRQQGSGVLNIGRTLACDAYITNSKGKPFSENLGESSDGAYSFSFVIHNESDSPRTFVPSVILQTDRCKTGSESNVINTLKPYSLSGNAEVVFKKGSRKVRAVTVSSGESVTIDVSIALSGAEVEKLMLQLSRGFYIDGFLLLSGEGGAEIYGAFSAFCGQLEEISPFDSTIYDNEKSVCGLESSLCAAAFKNGEPAFCTLRQEGTSLIFSKMSVGSINEDSEYGTSFILPDMNFLRDVFELKASVLSESGSTLVTCDLGSVGAYHDSGRRPCELLAGRAGELESFFAQLKDGSYQYQLSGRVKSAGGELSKAYTWTIPFECDSVRPTELSSRTYVENGRLILELSAKDRSGIYDFVLYATAYDKSDMDYRYADRLSELIAAGYIAEDSYTFLDKRINPDGAAVFRYDITELSSELVKLKLHTSSWINKSSSIKIAYKAVDNAYNESWAKTADAVVFGNATFSFTDQNGRPARNITVVLGDKKLTTDKTGTVSFENLVPDYYYAFASFDEGRYNIEGGKYLVRISNDDLSFSIDQKVEYLGEYTEEEEPSESSDASSAEKKLAANETSPVDDKGGDNPLYAIIFVCTLLAICGIAMILRMKHTNRHKDPDDE